MRDPVARVLSVYRRAEHDPPFEVVQSSLVDSGVDDLFRQIEVDADARRLLGRDSNIERWLGALQSCPAHDDAIDAAVAAVLDTDADDRSFAERARAVSKMGPSFAAAVARVRLVRELMTTLAELPRDAKLRRRHADAPRSGLVIEPPCAFGPSIAGHAHRFHLRRRIGEGSNGTVFEAVDLRYSEGDYEHVVVVKVLPPALADRAEAELLRGGRVNHPCVVRWLDCGTDSNRRGFVVSELVPGRTLEDPGTLQSLGRRGAVDAIRQIATGIDAAHAAGVLHLDIKPGNILISNDQRARLCDFGAARPLVDAPQAEESTTFFAAPEILEGHPAGVAADIYALGAVLRWSMDELDELAATPLDRADAQRLESIWSRAMSPAPENRHLAARELAADLDAWLQQRPLPNDAPSLAASLQLSMRRDPVTWTLAIAAAAAVVLFGWLWFDARLSASRRQTELLANEARRLRAEAFLSRYVDRLAEIARADGLSAAPQILAMQWLVGPRGIRDAELESRTREAQRSAWLAIIEAAERIDRRDHLEPKLAALCLADFDLESQRPERAAALLAADLPWWREHFAEDDAIRIVAEGLLAMAHIAVAEPARVTNPDECARALDALSRLADRRDPSQARRANEALDRLRRSRAP